jgi:excinuclease ABC subunit C
MNIENVKKLNIPTNPGSYQFIDKSGKIVYVGKAANLRSRIFSYWRESAEHSPAKTAMMGEIENIKWIETDTEIEALLLEANLIKKYQPYYNVTLRDDKRFIYIKVSTEEEWPRVFATRALDKSGRYFGPFVSSESVRETLKILRRIWPFRTCRHLPKRACLYYRIGQCPGMCLLNAKETKDKRKERTEEFVIVKKEYAKIIMQIVLFLEGKKGKVISNLELGIRDLEKEIKKLNKLEKLEMLKKTSPNPLLRKEGEELEKLKYQLNNLNRVLADARIVSVGEKYENDVVELAKLLNLPKVPERIEGYDIANIFGRSAVGSMVVFAGGEPDKNEYRKFKIRINEGEANDVGMLREILERRFKHGNWNPVCRRGRLEIRNLEIKKERKESGIGNRELGQTSPFPILRKEGDESWALPDLIVVDGGKGQLNVAVAVLKKFKLDIAVIAISKGEGLRSAHAPDKLFFPGEKKPLELPLASPAIHLIKRVRDEAHRFAIGYHRKVRGRRFLPRNI